MSPPDGGNIVEWKCVQGSLRAHLALLLVQKGDCQNWEFFFFLIKKIFDLYMSSD